MQLHTTHCRTALQEHKTHSCSYTHPTADLPCRNTKHTHAATHTPLQNCPAGTQNTLMQLHTPHCRTALQEHKTHSCSYTHPTAELPCRNRQHTLAATHTPLQNCPAGTENTLLQLHTPHCRTALQEHKTHSCSCSGYNMRFQTRTCNIVVCEMCDFQM